MFTTVVSRLVSEERSQVHPALAITEVVLIQGNIYVSDFKWSQFGSVAGAVAVLAVGYIATMLHNLPFSRLSLFS
jgi:hypothetical protein